jgi:hypothetical protein
MRRPLTWVASLAAIGLVAVAGGSAVCAGSAPPSIVASLPDTIATGELYILGNKIEPPYVFEVVRDSLYVNGTLVYPYRDFMAIPADSVVHLDMRAHRLGLALADSGRTDMEITEAIAAMYRSRPDLFVDVEIASAGWLTMRHVPSGIVSSVHCWSPEARTIPPPPTLAERIPSELEYIAYGLRRGAVVFVGVDGTRGFETTPREEYPRWVLKQLESPGLLRRLGRGGAGASRQP